MERRAAIDVLEQAHAATGRVTGPGRPLDVGKPVAHAYVLHVVAQFQGFVRDLHDLAALALVSAAGVAVQQQSMLIAAVTEGRGIDRGNASIGTVQADFRRLGLTAMNREIGKRQALWAVRDRRAFEELLALRNSLAHGNAHELAALRAEGILDTVSWTRVRLPVLNRTGKAMDHVVWDHFAQAAGAKPWE